MKTNSYSDKLTSLWIVIGILGRLIPHPANFTPLTNLCVFAGLKFNRFLSLFSVIVSLVISDILLSLLYTGTTAFSWNTLFTYSGWLGIMLCAGRLLKNVSTQRSLIYIFGFEFIFWLWTNFGFWLTQGIYARTFAGLLDCYIAGIPFLRNALLGDIVWFIIIFNVYAILKQRLAKNMQQKISV